MATGIRTTYSDSNVKPESLNTLLSMIDWTEAGLLRELGVNNESRFKFTFWPRTAYEWIEDTMSARTTTLAEAVDAGETAIDVTDGSIFKEGDIVKVDSELMYVSSVATNTITVTKGYAGTTDTTHDSGATITLATIARLEGADYDTGHTTTVTRNINYTQILSEAVKLTGSQTVDENYGIDDEMAYHIGKLIGGPSAVGQKGKAGKLPILLQQTFYHGQKAVGSASTSRAMGGFEEFVTTNVTNLNGAALELRHIEDLMEDCFLAGGMPSMLICNTWQRRKINSFFEGQIRTDRTEDKGGHVIKTIETVFGDIEVMFDRWCPTDRIYLIEPEKMGWITYRPFDIYDRASTGDYEVKEVLGEFGFVLMNESAHGYIHTASTTS